MINPAPCDKRDVPTFCSPLPLSVCCLFLTHRCVCLCIYIYAYNNAIEYITDNIIEYSTV